MKNEIAILEKFVKHPPFGRSPGGTGHAHEAIVDFVGM
jgi:hypothetical protein